MIPVVLIAAALTAGAVLTWVISREPPRGIVVRIGRRTPPSLRERYARALDLLGASVEPEFITGLKYGGTVLGLGLAAFAYLLAGWKAAVLPGFLAVFAWVYPESWLAQKEKARINDLRREFPLMVTLVRVYARASDLYQALRITREALRGELRRQMDILAGELAVYPLKEALENFAKRCRYPLVASFVSVVLFGIQTGTDVDHILASFSRRSYEARVNEIKRKIKAQPILLSILPAAMMLALLLLFVFPMYANIIDKLRAF